MTEMNQDGMICADGLLWSPDGSLTDEGKRRGLTPRLDNPSLIDMTDLENAKGWEPKRRRKLFIFKLGDLEEQIFPTEAAVTKLAQILREASSYEEAADDLAIIWGPELQVESYEIGDGDIFVLGQEKNDE